MKGDSCNRIAGLDPTDLPLLSSASPGDVLQGIHDQHTIAAPLGKTVIPVLETIEYGVTTGDHVEFEYTFQRRVPGRHCRFITALR